MLWLAPPILFTAGFGVTLPSDNDSFSYRPDPTLFVDARVGYPLESNTVGLRVRGFHTTIHWGDSLPPPGYSSTFELYTFDIGVFGEVSSGYFNAMGWVGAHNARVHATYSQVTTEREKFFSGPALAGGITLGVNAYTAGRFRVTVFGEVGIAGDVFMTNNAPGGDSYEYNPLSLGVAVRF